MIGSSSVLFRNERKTIWLIDLTRSIEESQILVLGAGELPSRRHRVRKATPAEPFATPEAKDGNTTQNAHSHAAQINELMTLARVSEAWEELRHTYSGPWCLARSPPPERLGAGREAEETPALAADQAGFYIPPGSQYLSGTIEEMRESFIRIPKLFDLVILDPPWPNRSARRKRGNYHTAPGLDSIRQLLSLIPIGSKLAADGTVAVWVTNKPAVIDLVCSPGGVFSQWGVELVDTWTWLKVTTSGKPIFALDAQWRKPWEQLLIARRLGSRPINSSLGRVLVAVPDVHSRNPNMRRVFDDYLQGSYSCIEVFARNLTAGWWSWGGEVLLFQGEQHWIQIGQDAATELERGEERQGVEAV